MHKKDIQIAKGAYLPSLTGFYGFNTRASNADRVLGVDAGGNFITGAALPIFQQFDKNKGQNFGIQFSLPIFNGFAVKNNVSRAKSSF